MKLTPELEQLISDFIPDSQFMNAMQSLRSKNYNIKSYKLFIEEISKIITDKELKAALRKIIPENDEELPITRFVLTKTKELTNYNLFDFEERGLAYIYKVIIKNIVKNNNKNAFRELVSSCLTEWSYLIVSKVNSNHTLISQSLHYKSPGFGTWFRIPDIELDNDNFFNEDTTVYELYKEKYLTLPEILNLSLDNGDTSELFKDDIIIETNRRIEKIE